MTDKYQAALTPNATANTEPIESPIVTAMATINNGAEEIKQAFDQITALHNRINSLVCVFEQMIKDCTEKCKLLDNCSSCC